MNMSVRGGRIGRNSILRSSITDKADYIYILRDLLLSDELDLQEDQSQYLEPLG